MTVLVDLNAYEDESGNRIVYDGPALPDAAFKVTFQGKRNLLKIHAGAKIVHLSVLFSGDGATAEIGSTPKPRTGLRFTMRLGHECTVQIGENVGCETPTFIAVSEGQTVSIGQDCMIATAVELRADDSHPIYDVASRKRVNPARSIHIGDHVWLGKSVVVMAGATVGDGSVIGFRSIVTRKIPNNAIAVGAPARVVRRNIAWERPMLAARRPGIDGVPKGEKLSAPWWNLSDDSAPAAIESRTSRLFGLRRAR